MKGHYTAGTYLDGDGRTRTLDVTTARVRIVRDAVAGSTRPETDDLRLHLVARHASPGASWMTPDELDEHHKHEHDGPCTIRNHDRGDLSWDRGDAVEVLNEILNSP